ncbi:MAG: helix-turn-helix domain-containing protein [Promethearchaeota archaeon]
MNINSVHKDTVHKDIVHKDIVHTNFHFQIPKGKILSKLSLFYPQLKFELLSLLPLPFPDKMGMSLIQIKGPNLTQFVENLAQMLKSSQYTILHNLTENLLLNLYMKDPWFLLTIIKTNIILKYPIIVQDNRIYVDLIAERQKIDQLFDEFESHHVEYSVRHIGRFSQSPILSSKQEYVLKVLLKNGYFEIPRARSLSQIANELKVAPASLSEMIRRIFKNLCTNYFAPMEFE